MEKKTLDELTEEKFQEAIQAGEPISRQRAREKARMQKIEEFDKFFPRRRTISRYVPEDIGLEEERFHKEYSVGVTNHAVERYIERVENDPERYYRLDREIKGLISSAFYRALNSDVVRKAVDVCDSVEGLHMYVDIHFPPSHYSDNFSSINKIVVAKNNSLGDKYIIPTVVFSVNK